MQTDFIFIICGSIILGIVLIFLYIAFLRSRRKAGKLILLNLSVAVLLLAAGLGGTYALYRSKVTVQNKLSLGCVDISMQQMHMTDDGKTVEPCEENHTVSVIPSQTVPGISRITCTESPCYLRAKLSWVTEGPKGLSDEDIFTISENDISGIPDTWIKRGEYYYYTKCLNNSEYVDFINNITISPDYTERTPDQKLLIDVDVDAIQAENFTPNFSSDDPWFGQEIIKNVKTRSNGYTEDSYSEKGMKITFEGNARKLMSSTDDFFSSFGEMMPGDTLNGKILVKNTTGDVQDISFRMTMPEKYLRSSYDLLSLIGLKVMNGKETVYEGTVADAYKAGDINLGRYKKGGSSQLSFELKVSEKINSRLALADGRTIWTFSAVSADPDSEPPKKNVANGDGGSNSDGAGNPGNSGNSEKGGGYVPVVAPKTGDGTNASIYVMLLGACLFTCAILESERRKANEKR